MIRARSEECNGISDELFAEQKRVFSRDELSQLSSSFQQWVVAEIFAIEKQKVEGTEDEALELPPDR